MTEFKQTTACDEVVYLRVPREHLEKLRKETQNAYPNETCGLLFGYRDGDCLIATETEVLPNLDHSSVSFNIDPMDLYKALVDAEGRGLSLVAIFHSHGMDARPSGKDKEFMGWWPVPWLILSTTNNKFGAFILDKDRCREVKIRVTKTRANRSRE